MRGLYGINRKSMAHQFLVLLWNRPMNFHPIITGRLFTKNNMAFSIRLSSKHRSQFRLGLVLQPFRYLNLNIPIKQVNYTFRVFAQNAMGSSLPAFAPKGSLPCSTPPAIPYNNPSGVKVVCTLNRNLYIILYFLNDDFGIDIF